MKYLLIFLTPFFAISCVMFESKHSELGDVSVGDEFVVKSDVLIFSLSDNDLLKRSSEGRWEQQKYNDPGDRVYLAFVNVKSKDSIGVDRDDFWGSLDGHDGLYFVSGDTARRIVCILNRGDTVSVTDIRTIRGFSLMTLWGGSSWIYAKSPKCDYVFNAAALFSMGMDRIMPQDDYIERVK